MPCAEVICFNSGEEKNFSCTVAIMLVGLDILDKSLQKSFDNVFGL